MIEAGFEIPVANPDSFIQQTRVIPFQDSTGGMSVDIVLAGPGLEELFLDRIQKKSLEEILVPIISPEDLIVTKILAARQKDLTDVRNLIKVQGKRLDVAWIRQLLEELEAALGQSDLLPVFEEIFSDP